MKIKVKILDYDLDNLNVTLIWNDNTILSHTIPTFFTEGTTDEEIQQFLLSIAPIETLREYEEFQEKKEMYSARFEILKELEWELEVPSELPKEELRDEDFVL